jgi:hypothetical protein
MIGGHRTPSSYQNEWRREMKYVTLAVIAIAMSMLTGCIALDITKKDMGTTSKGGVGRYQLQSNGTIMYKIDTVTGTVWEDSRVEGFHVRP